MLFFMMLYFMMLSNSTKATFTIPTHFASDCFVVAIILLTELMVIFKAEETIQFVPLTIKLNKGLRKKIR